MINFTTNLIVYDNWSDMQPGEQGSILKISNRPKRRIVIGATRQLHGIPGQIPPGPGPKPMPKQKPCKRPIKEDRNIRPNLPPIMYYLYANLTKTQLNVLVKLIEQTNADDLELNNTDEFQEYILKMVLEFIKGGADKKNIPNKASINPRGVEIVQHYPHMKPHNAPYYPYYGSAAQPKGNAQPVYVYQPQPVYVQQPVYGQAIQEPEEYPTYSSSDVEFTTPYILTDYGINEETEDFTTVI